MFDCYLKWLAVIRDKWCKVCASLFGNLVLTTGRHWRNSTTQTRLLMRSRMSSTRLTEGAIRNVVINWSLNFVKRRIVSCTSSVSCNCCTFSLVGTLEQCCMIWAETRYEKRKLIEPCNRCGNLLSSARPVIPVTVVPLKSWHSLSTLEKILRYCVQFNLKCVITVAAVCILMFYGLTTTIVNLYRYLAYLRIRGVMEMMGHNSRNFRIVEGIQDLPQLNTTVPNFPDQNESEEL